MSDKELLHAVLRTDLNSFTQKSFYTLAAGPDFLPNWHLEAIAYHLELCREGKIKRLVITLPPRSLKSISASVAFPAFLLGRDPTLKIICASYSQDLANALSMQTRTVMEAAWYKAAFRHTRTLQHAANAPDFYSPNRPLPAVGHLALTTV